LAETFARLYGWIPASQIWVLTNAKHVGLVRKLCPQLKKENVIGEPMGKDTAPCIAVASALIAKKNPNAVMVVLPADHLIQPKKKFQQVLSDAALMAYGKRVLVTLGIKPSRPHTGYGYIQIEKKQKLVGKSRFHRVIAFKEKPNLEPAKKIY